MISRPARLGLAVMAICTAVACADSALTGPLQTHGDRALAQQATPSAGDVVLVLKRSAELPAGLTTSAVIGPRGGRLSIPTAGIRVDFPRGAVAVPMLITLSAVAGENVAYEFQPHGLQFAAPVSVRQSLKHTAAEGNDQLAASLQGSYVGGDFLFDRKGKYARIQEARPGKHHPLGRFLEFSIEHFSGYMVSTGDLGLPIDIDIRIMFR